MQWRAVGNVPISRQLSALWPSKAASSLHCNQIIALAAQYGLPAIYDNRQLAEAVD
jgi:hypothetical protein